MTLEEWSRAQADRCPGCGFHLRLQGCRCDAGEWATFVSALRTAAAAGVIHQSAMRDLIRGRIAPKHVGQLYQRAVRNGLIVREGLDVSDDEAGKNAGRIEPRYRLLTTTTKEENDAA